MSLPGEKTEQRIIKFRVWDKVARQMSDPFHLFGEFTLVGGVHSWQYDVRGGIAPTGLESLNDLIEMQFTGLHDKNGVEIYEGDVVKCNTKGRIPFPHKGPVEYVDSYFAVKTPSAVDGESEYTPMMFNENFEVLGNVYAKPELL